TAVADGGATEEHQWSPLRSTAAEPPPWSPDRTAWAAAETPWLTNCSRRSLRAHAGGPPEPLGGRPVPPDEAPVPDATDARPLPGGPRHRHRRCLPQRVRSLPPRPRQAGVRRQ